MNEIISKLALINHDSKSRFAVRSSAVLEDGEESSAAGQNETFLGLRTNEEVFIALIKCWASLFSFQSVSYRKYTFVIEKKTLIIFGFIFKTTYSTNNHWYGSSYPENGTS